MVAVTKNPTVNDSIRNILINTVILIVCLVLLGWLASAIFHADIGLSKPSIWIGAGGTILAFIGNNFVTDAARRLDADKTILWRVGNPLQATGFILVLLALIIE